MDITFPFPSFFAKSQRVLGMALALALLVLGTSSCVDEEANWLEAEGPVRAFMEQLSKRNYGNAHGKFKTGAGLGSMSTQEFEDFIGAYENTGLLDFTYKIERHKADTRAGLYIFRVKREYKTKPDLSKAPEGANKFFGELDDVSPYTEFVVQKFHDEGWKITSATAARDYDVGLGTREEKK